ncbi:MAG: helix-turn-helix domain-containing protein [Bacteroidetes bacterium]|nr:helix-turn-helix domain-containing protein [Bacteroidota bacterium]MCB0842227.1 helix-turn-helix domain-containing protein [Bacteroidota bacterium]
MSFFGNNLRYIRNQKKLDLAGFARLIDVWEDTLRRYENGKAEPDFDTLVQISDKLNLPIDHLLRKDLALQQERLSARKIRLVLLDMDGTLTDGGMFYSESGDQFRRFNVKDGLIIHRMITRKGMQFGLISSGSTIEILKSRAKALGIQRVHSGTQPKLEIVGEWMAQMGLGFENIAYVGDDLNDLPLIKKVGISACPADAAFQVKNASMVVLTRKGGEGCIREFLEDVLGFDVS